MRQLSSCALQDQAQYLHLQLAEATVAQVSQSWKTRQVSSIEVFSASGSELAASLEITISGGTLSSTDHLAFQLTGASAALDTFMGSFVLFFRCDLSAGSAHLHLLLCQRCHGRQLQAAQMLVTPRCLAAPDPFPGIFVSCAHTIPVPWPKTHCEHSHRHLQSQFNSLGACCNPLDLRPQHLASWRSKTWLAAHDLHCVMSWTWTPVWPTGAGLASLC